MKRAVVVGAAGQDGVLLTEHLGRLGYQITGLSRQWARGSTGETTPAIDVLDPAAVGTMIRDVQPDEVYYLAAFHQSSEARELLSPESLWVRSFDVHLHGLLNFLEALRRHAREAHLFYAASSLVFGDPVESPQTERTPLNPVCVYGISKTAGVHACRLFRSEHGLRASVGFLYNHESHLRPGRFLSARITDAAIRIRHGQQRELVLGDLSAQTDWGYAPDYVDAMHRIAQLPAGGDFVVATGVLRRVCDFAEAAFSAVGLNWRDYVREERSLITRRKQPLVGDPSKLGELTGWTPVTPFEEMIHRILSHKGATR
jgi:GDPmannose 4,6-dehydratase